MFFFLLKINFGFSLGYIMSLIKKKIIKNFLDQSNALRAHLKVMIIELVPVQVIIKIEFQVIK